MSKLALIVEKTVVEIDTDKVDDVSYRLALQFGLQHLVETKKIKLGDILFGAIPKKSA